MRCSLKPVATVLAALAVPLAAATSLETEAGRLRMRLETEAEGIRLVSLGDAKTSRALTAARPVPLFTLVLNHVPDRREARLSAAEGWQQLALKRAGQRVDLRWAAPKDTNLTGISVIATATADSARDAWRWSLQVQNRNPAWSVGRVIFPDLAVAPPAGRGAVLFPRGPGEAQTGVWDRPFRYRGNYPGGWCSMQFLAAYSEEQPESGLYVAVHDPNGSTKDILVESDPAARCVKLRFEHPAPNLGLAANDFALSGAAIWQLFRGDWFDAASLYREWVRKEAQWWPKLKSGERADTARWMRELNVWTLGGGAPAECVDNVMRFREFLGVPAGFHWYNWHQIPFDNDYPHYFPAKAGFPEGVARLKQAEVRVMPYINGRLWDSLDRGAEDFEFSQVALAAASKGPDGKPYLESYGSKETNGQPVRLAAMCPATALWKRKVKEIVLKLLGEVGTSAVYIDQVAAASPTLCQDPSHQHPLGGGHWWNQGYWDMLETIRQSMPPETMLTTECNGEPFIRWFDGYLTWHWQHDGQVPAFPAIYGAAIQMFGRAYRSGATKDLALRMKAGQQLVFGEQLGWIDPGIVQEKENAEFFRQLVQLRAQFNRYFAAGQMDRPPRLVGAMPKVKADWQWSGEWWVTTDAVLTGAWRLAAAKRLALFFVNVSDQPVGTVVRFNAGERGLRSRKLRLQETVQGKTVKPWETVPAALERPLNLPPREARVWELNW